MQLDVSNVCEFAGLPEEGVFDVGSYNSDTEHATILYFGKSLTDARRLASDIHRDSDGEKIGFVRDYRGEIVLCCPPQLELVRSA